MNYLQLAGYFFEYYTALQRQKKFIAQHLEPFINSYETELGYRLNKADRKKVLIYYPCFTVLGGADNFALLKNRSITPQENWRLTVVSAMSSLCDDLIDEENWNADQLLQLLDLKLDNLPISPKTNMILRLNEELHRQNPPSAAYEQQLRTAIEWQAASLQQLSPGISTGRIIEISREKNGNTSLMFASLMDEDWTEAEKAVIHYSGYLGQLVNDSYDVYKDVPAGVQTYIQRTKSIDEAETFFLAEWRKLVALIMQTNASTKNKDRLINRFACFHGYALVAFNQFRLIEQKRGKPVPWKEATRKELVIDMERWPTRLQLLKCIKKLSKYR
ncbi:hypothetical protein [Foetidibacter luteolus]|uniref:hypothetical protein n=1 Tax=Foetidibacter luteolus TaxID=2608880 RepID=UPI00129A3050|nr:hypothetical protein [Foetidibacter luteolus]